MSLDDWLLALHLLAAFALVAAITVFWILILLVRGADTPARVLDLRPLLKVGGIVVVAGSLGTVVFGVWLAVALDAYHPWDGWVVAAIVLWAIASEAGRRSDPEFAPAFTRARQLHDAGVTGPTAELAALCRPRRGLVLHAIASVAVLLILLDMIWKPGA